MVMSPNSTWPPVSQAHADVPVVLCLVHKSDDGVVLGKRLARFVSARLEGTASPPMMATSAFHGSRPKAGADHGGTEILDFRFSVKTTVPLPLVVEAAVVLIESDPQRRIFSFDVMVTVMH